MHVSGRSKNHYVFLFEWAGDMYRIVDNGPYAIQGALIIVDYWKPDLVLDRLIFDKMMVWVQLYGLPLECFTEEAGVRLGRTVGEVVKVDIDSLMPRNICFLRLRVWVSLDKPLISGFFLKFRNGQQHWISCRYERVCKDMGRRLHSQVMTQDLHLMYFASIRANAHRSDRRTTRIFQNSTHSHMEILEEVVSPTHGHDTNLDADFADMWERDWDTSLQQGTPEGGEPPMPVVRRDGVILPASSQETRLVVSDVLSGLGQAPVDSVGPLLASIEDVLRAIQLNGPSLQLNLPMGEALILTQAFIRESPSSWTNMGSVTYEVGQSSSIMDFGPQNSAVIAAIFSSIPPIFTLSGPSIRKRLREMDLGFDLLYDTKPMLITDKVRGPLQDCSNEMFMHSLGIVSNSVCPPQSLGSLLRKHLSRRKKARYSIPSVMHANAVPWPIREESARFSSLRRRQKLCFRSHHLFAATGSSPGSTSWRRRG
ncbi:hypothetical protein LOK49_LG10G02396 [Camellia lanceoleosa]|uniref:Uncharacterized protein n=1 Tax=Camellia lanceoleosa TaxID=1840588 RepID=A0ACC0G6Q3_9ERIC|nr:hypothetical protein LOK49_LG10G02396 [Camellia lanceoleosa]